MIKIISVRLHTKLSNAGIIWNSLSNLLVASVNSWHLSHWFARTVRLLLPAKTAMLNGKSKRTIKISVPNASIRTRNQSRWWKLPWDSETLSMSNASIFNVKSINLKWVLMIIWITDIFNALSNVILSLLQKHILKNVWIQR